MRVSFLALLALGVTGLAGCNDYKINAKGGAAIDDVEDGVPDISVTPEKIEFGQVNVGDAPKIETVTVRNDGDAALQIESLALEDETKPYDISAIGSVLIPPGTSTTFTVTYEAETSRKDDTKVLIGSNDPDESVVKVPLTAEGVAPVIQLDPVSYDFGATYIGCELSSKVIISNIGTADLVVSDFSYVTASNDLFFDDGSGTNGELPWTIAKGDFKEVYVDYAPLDDYADEGFLSVESNDPIQPTAKASQVGNAALFGQNLDVFQQPLRSSADLLFIVDNSCSMSEEQSSLTNNFTTFINTLTLTDADYHIGVITTDNPAFRGDMITNESSDPVAEFITQATPGISGSGDEQGNEMAYQALQPGGDAGPGSDFFRDDAQLSIVIVSDEHDSSRSSWATYVAYFWSLKSDSDNVIEHAIAGDYPSGCATAEAGTGYYEAVSAMGGLYLSICATDWASHLESLAEVAAADLSSFELTDFPVPESIVVTVDGVTTTQGWTYNSADNAVDFDDDHIPEGGSTIEVDYALYGDCSQ